MKLEKGKTYLTAHGARVEIVADDMPGNMPILGIIRYPNGEATAQTWTAQGQYYTSIPCETMDLVGEYVDRPEFDRSLLPAWANKAIAMNSDGGWFCFSDRPKFVAGGVWGRLGLWVCEIPLYCAPKWEGAAEDSLLVWEDEE